jgi:hypothetical protein
MLPEVRKASREHEVSENCDGVQNAVPTSTRETKKQIIETVIQRVTDSGGRFIKESDDQMSMEVVTPQYVYVKVSHALRSSRLSKQQEALLLLPPGETATGTEGPPQLLSPGAVFDNLLATQQRLFYSSVSGSAACSHSDDGDDDDNDEIVQWTHGANGHDKTAGAASSR